VINRTEMWVLALLALCWVIVVSGGPACPARPHARLRAAWL